MTVIAHGKFFPWRREVVMRAGFGFPRSPEAALTWINRSVCGGNCGRSEVRPFHENASKLRHDKDAECLPSIVRFNQK